MLHVPASFIQPRLPRYQTTQQRVVDMPSPPYHVAVLIVKKGTLEGKTGIVMADEAMAYGVARGIKKHGGRHVQTVEVCTPDEDLSWANIIVSMHHAASQAELNKNPDSKTPMWLWVHNPGWTSTLQLKKERGTIYQEIFHAGKHLSSRAGFPYLPSGLEDPTLFKPSSAPKRWSLSFIANMRLHRDITPLLLKLQSSLRDMFIAGAEWGRIGLRVAGPIPFNEVGDILNQSRICLDHVSPDHVIEGNSSTRIYQAIACGSTVVSMQPPDSIPSELRPYIHFTKGHDETYETIMRLHNNPVERAKRRPNNVDLRYETCEYRGREIWNHISKTLR